jgi:hypothetical protein
MNEDVKQFLESIKELKQKSFNVFQYSSANDIPCVPITFKQQKSLISTVTEGTSGILKFQKILNEIILENTQNEELLICDKIPIILKMRGESLGNEIKNGEDVIDISKNIQKSQKGAIKFPKPIVIKNLIDVELYIPSLKEENKILSHSIDILKKDGEQDIGKNIGNIYTFEIAKFIKSVKFGENVLDFLNLPIKDRVNIVENLPIIVNKEIVEFIESFKKVEKDFLNIKVDGDDKYFDIDVTFFDN